MTTKDLRFTEETVQRVKANWLTKENKEAFANCKNDVDYCITFFRISNEQQSELSLGDKIFNQVVDQVNNR